MSNSLLKRLIALRDKSEGADRATLREAIKLLEKIEETTHYMHKKIKTGLHQEPQNSEE